MTEQELKEIEARANAATPGPWLCEVDPLSPDSESDLIIDGERKASTAGYYEMGDLGHSDIAFIAHAREDVPALVAEVRALRGTIERYKRNVQRRLTLQLRMRERDE